MNLLKSRHQLLTIQGLISIVSQKFGSLKLLTILSSIAALASSAPAHSETPIAIAIYDKQKISDICGDYSSSVAHQDSCTGYMIGIVEAISRRSKERDRILSCALPMRYKIFDTFRDIAKQKGGPSRPSVILMKSIKVICP